jgi:hypothetical protein
VRFKVDENLPAEAAAILREAAFDADSVVDENLSGGADETIAARLQAEGRILLTLDLDFSNIQAYDPRTFAVWSPPSSVEAPPVSSGSSKKTASASAVRRSCGGTAGRNFLPALPPQRTTQRQTSALLRHFGVIHERCRRGHG